MGRIVFEEILVPYFNETRNIRIYLPNKYDWDQKKSYPVLYMQDGQNLFSDELAYGGHSWRIIETMERLEQEGRIDGIIVVGIDHAGDKRLIEYAPFNVPEVVDRFNENQIGEGLLYSDFLVNTVKPFIDAKYRTLRNCEHTAIAGSSMGGLISTYIGLMYPDVFSKIGAFSTASWFCEEPLLDLINQQTIDENQSYYLQVGTNESTISTDPSNHQIYLDNTLKLHHALLSSGLSVSQSKLVIEVGGIHHESVWAKHFQDFIEFIFIK
jgi:predicted alpha/beta superfamily hydrolase